MRIADFDYDLPSERIALHPPETRGDTRLLVVNRADNALQHRRYADLAEYLNPGDVLVLNKTKVDPARVVAHNAAGAPRELIVLEEMAEPCIVTALVKGRVHSGEILTIEDHSLTIGESRSDGVWRVTLPLARTQFLEKFGTTPIPPYLHRDSTDDDAERYQTIFAQKEGSVAAPTASLNLTEELVGNIKEKGVRIAWVTLSVGLGTFLPVRAETVEEHTMHTEHFTIPEDTIRAIQEAKARGSRVIAVGTTVARTLESGAHQVLSDTPTEFTGQSSLFIYPGYSFRVVDVLVTNFHAPCSTVLLLASAFAGTQLLREAYEEALAHEYAFLSYGDSMLIL